MKTLRIILIALLVVYGLGPLFGALFSFFAPAKQAALQHLGDMTAGTEKLLQLSAALLAGQAWLYFSALALLVTKMKEGYLYAVTIGIIEMIQAVVIVVALRVHHFGSGADFLALLKGAILLAVALAAFKKSQTPTPARKPDLSGGHAASPA